ncbi:MAG: hypothetical protein QOG90_1935 [Actinomycetota bacterium]|jgi:hypothetical protein
MTTNPDALAFYAAQGPMSRLPEDTKADDIPEDLAAMRTAVQGLLVHRDCVKAYGLTDGDVRLDEQNIRTIDGVMTRAFELSPEPLQVARPPAARVQGICRHFALLHVAFLRAHGMPARMRCGFAGYFGNSGKWYDHWITERWDGDRWVRDDPQVDAVQRKIAGIDFDVNDQPAGKFLSANEAWALTRAGELDPQNFGIFDMWGAGFIAGNVVSDFACVNRMEMLPWDFWSPLTEGGPSRELGATAPIIDELAALMATDDFDAIRTRYLDDDRLRVPQNIMTMVDGETVAAVVEVD